MLPLRTEFLGALDADRQTGATLGAARFQDIAPTLALHFFAKAMHAQAVQPFWLINSLHDEYSSEKLDSH